MALRYEPKDGDQLRVYYDKVPYFPQKRAMSCWYACAKMLKVYRNSEIKFKSELDKSVSGKKLLELLEKSSRFDGTQLNEDTGCTEKEWPLLTEAMGFQLVSTADATQCGADFNKLQEALSKYGPLWCAGKYYQQGNKDAGHVILVVGALTRQMPNVTKALIPRDFIIFHDPDMQGNPPTNGSKNADNCLARFDLYFKKGFYDTGVGPGKTDGISPLLYLPAS